MTLLELARAEREDLLELLRAHLTPTGLTAGLGGAIGLTDGIIHRHDIRRPLGELRTIPADRPVARLLPEGDFLAPHVPELEVFLRAGRRRGGRAWTGRR